VGRHESTAQTINTRSAAAFTCVRCKQHAANFTIDLETGSYRVTKILANLLHLRQICTNLEEYLDARRAA
jgi:hypothetical protein